MTGSCSGAVGGRATGLAVAEGIWRRAAAGFRKAGCRH